VYVCMCAVSVCVYMCGCVYPCMCVYLCMYGCVYPCMFVYPCMCNGKLRDELLNGEIFYTLKEAQILIEQWRIHYNTVRPHSSLGYRSPVPQTVMTKLIEPRFVMPAYQELQ